jgi:hypothetical protein
LVGDAVAEEAVEGGDAEAFDEHLGELDVALGEGVGFLAAKDHESGGFFADQERDDEEGGDKTGAGAAGGGGVEEGAACAAGGDHGVEIGDLFAGEDEGSVDVGGLEAVGGEEAAGGFGAEFLPDGEGEVGEGMAGAECLGEAAGGVGGEADGLALEADELGGDGEGGFEGIVVGVEGVPVIGGEVFRGILVAGDCQEGLAEAEAVGGAEGAGFLEFDAVEEGAVLAAEIADDGGAVDDVDHGVVAGDAIIGEGDSGAGVAAEEDGSVEHETLADRRTGLDDQEEGRL